MTAKNTLNKLFPVPTSLASPLAPRPFASPSPAVIPRLLELLKENHDKHHWSFKGQNLHNHISHHLLAQYFLGASVETIEKGYNQEASYQVAAYESPEAITQKNVFEHVGKPDFYNAYRDFFAKEVLEKGQTAALEEYVFSPKANVAEGGKEGPMALCRFLAGLVHPMIHTDEQSLSFRYGFEFGLPGMVVEGLAQTYIHPKENDLPLVPPALFTGSLQSNSKQEGIHAFTVLSRMIKDTRWDGNDWKASFAGNYGGIIREHGNVIYDYAKEWSIDMGKDGEVERKMEELIWLNSILYVIGGWKKNEEHYNEFFIMHLVTSSLFLPSLLPSLSPASQELLLRGHLTVSLGWWVARGKLVPNILEFYKHTANYAVSASDGNPWFPILKNSILHYDDHLGKLQRAFAHFSSLPKFGGRVAGMDDFKGTGLEGAELLDGSLFLRGAILTREAMGESIEDKWWKGNTRPPEMSNNARA